PIIYQLILAHWVPILFIIALPILGDDREAIIRGSGF
ncbi:hypothetical protein MNBD_GAMMA26-756, partial [hydrothermal vent metagenome]